jgi:hypothetical protein
LLRLHRGLGTNLKMMRTWVIVKLQVTAN